MPTKGGLTPLRYPRPLTATERAALERRQREAERIFQQRSLETTRRVAIERACDQARRTPFAKLQSKI